MSDNLKPFQYHIIAFFIDVSFFTGNSDLFIHTVNTINIRQQQSSSAILCRTDHSILMHIQLTLILYSFRIAKHINRNLQSIQLFFPDRRKARIS